MPSALPPELRLALVAAKRKEPHLSLRALAARFGLGPSTVSRWWRRWESERNLAPKLKPKQRIIPKEHAAWLAEAATQVRSLKALAQAYAFWSGQKVHPTTLSRRLKGWGIALPHREACALWGLGFSLARMA